MAFAFASMDGQNHIGSRWHRLEGRIRGHCMASVFSIASVSFRVGYHSSMHRLQTSVYI